MARLLPFVKQQFSDGNGDPIAGGKVYSYIAGTTTPLTTYTDQSGGTPNANPVILDANGEADVWLGSGSYKIVITDANDVVLKTVDNVDGGTAAENTTNPWATHNVTDGQSATNLTSQTVNLAVYSSAQYEVEILRGTTVIANGSLAVQSVNGTGRVVLGEFITNEAHGVSFSVSQVSTTVQLKAALDASAGNGTIKLRRSLVPV